MSIKIDRFEKKEIIQTSAQIKIENLNTILIKDHQTDNIVSYVQLFNDKKKNKECADRVITAIEDYIMELENDSEDQNQEI